MNSNRLEETIIVVAGVHTQVFNRVDNVKFWLKEFPDWNLEARDTVVGGLALGSAVYMGPNRFELTKLLLGLSVKRDFFLGAGL